MIVQIDTNQTQAGPFSTDAEYVQFVMGWAAVSYQKQFGTATTDEGITAAREAYNASLPPLEVPAQEDQPTAQAAADGAISEPNVSLSGE